MKLKFAMIFAVAGLSLASAKSYDVSLSGASKIGNVELKAGDYKMAVDGAKATFTSVATGKSVEVDAKVENADKKFAQTSVDTTGTSSPVKVDEIDLRGTTTKVLFQ